MPSIIIDAGHGGSDYGAVNGDRKEKDDNLELALMVGKILADNGVDVLYTRTEDVYDTPYEKAAIANNSGADYFLSIHRNAAATPGTGSGIETLVYRDSGVASELARNINANLSEIGFTDRGVIERPGLVVLRRTSMPAVLVEAGFIDNASDNELYDANLRKVAEAIADGFLETIGVEKESEGEGATVPWDDAKLYRVQVGAFEKLDNAVKLEQELKKQGYPAFVTTR